VPNMTYTSLQQDVQRWTERTDETFVAVIPTLITLAEARIAREVKVLGLESFVTGNFTPGSPTLPKPARWRETLWFFYGPERTQLFLRPLDFCRNYWPTATETGAPKYFADYSFDYFLIAPTPVAASNFELSFFQLPEPLSDQVSTNWLTQYAPDLILYATLLEAIPYLQEMDKIEVWQSRYDRAAQALGSENKSRTVDAGAVVKG